MKVLAIVLGFGAIFCWGINSLMINKGLKNTDVSTFNAIRMIPAFILLVLFMLYTDTPIFPRMDLSILAILTGFLSYSLAYGLFLQGLKRGLTHRVWPVGNSAPLWGVVAAIMFLGEGANLFVILSIILVVSGICLLRHKNSNGGMEGEKRGIFLAFFAALLWGVLIVPNKYCLNEGMAPLSFLTCMIIAGTIANNAFLLFQYSLGKSIFDKKGITWSIFSGIVALLGGGLFWQFALSIEKASRLAPLMGIETLIVFLLSIFLLRESSTKRSFLGIALVILGVFLVTSFG